MIRNKIKYLFYGVLIFLFVGVVNHYTTYKLELLGHYSKIGAHRVNSIEKLSSAVKYFEIIELDLEYDDQENYLDVNHPPTTSIKLKLENYLAVIDSNQKPFLWLDVKNLTRENSERILNRLLYVFKVNNYPLERVLVESLDSNALSVFTRAGFKTSYYLPFGLCKMSDKDLRKSIADIKEVLRVQPNISISSDIQDYEILTENFPSVTKYTWTMGAVFGNHFIQTQKALRDPHVNIVLVTYNAPKGNR